MFRYYYDDQGNITLTMNTEIAIDQGQYIDVDQAVRISDWLVDVNTRTLIPNPNPRMSRSR